MSMAHNLLTDGATIEEPFGPATAVHSTFSPGLSSAEWPYYSISGALRLGFLRRASLAPFDCAQDLRQGLRQDHSTKKLPITS